MYLYSPSTNGFYLSEIHGDNIPPDVLEVEDARYRELFEGQAEGKVIQPGVDGAPALIDCPVPARVIPQQVTKRQGRRALLAAGKLAAVTAAIAALPSPQREEAEIDWEDATYYERSSPFVTLLAEKIGLDDEALDALFVAAAAL